MCVNIYKMSSLCSPWTLQVGVLSICFCFVLVVYVTASFDNVNRISETFTVIDDNNDDATYKDDDDV